MDSECIFGGGWSSGILVWGYLSSEASPLLLLGTLGASKIYLFANVTFRGHQHCITTASLNLKAREGRPGVSNCFPSQRSRQGMQACLSFPLVFFSLSLSLRIATLCGLSIFPPVPQSPLNPKLLSETIKYPQAAPALICRLYSGF